MLPQFIATGMWYFRYHLSLDRNGTSLQRLERHVAWFHLRMHLKVWTLRFELPNSRFTKGLGFEVICPVSRLSTSPMNSSFSPRAEKYNYYQGSNYHASIEPWWWTAWVLLESEKLGLEWTSGGQFSQHSSVCGPWSGRHQAVARKLCNALIFQQIHSFPHVGASKEVREGEWDGDKNTV